MNTLKRTLILGATLFVALNTASCRNVSRMQESEFTAGIPTVDLKNNTQPTVLGRYKANANPLTLDFWVRPGFPQMAMSFSYLNKDKTQGGQSLLLTGIQARKLFSDMENAKFEITSPANENIKFESKLSPSEGVVHYKVKPGLERKVKFSYEKIENKKTVLQIKGAFVVNSKGEIFRFQVKAESLKKFGPFSMGLEPEFEHSSEIKPLELGVSLREESQLCRIENSNALLVQLETKKVQVEQLMSLCI